MAIAKTRLALTGASIFMLVAAPASAHHSFAMFDYQKNVTLSGTIKAFEWTNPHIWVELVEKDAVGKEAQWSIEGGSPNVLLRQGWKRSSLKPGDAAIVVIHPLKDGSAGGSLVSLTVNGVKMQAGK